MATKTTTRNGESLSSLPGQEDDICPVCKSSRYLNPNMRFLVNPECYHKMCESCVDRIFSTGPAPCPVAGCRRTLRKARFRRQTFEDLQIEKEVDIRRRVATTFNRRREEFEDLLSYNNYLEEVETLTFNLVYSLDVDTTEAKLKAYASQNAPVISRNAALERQESANTEATFKLQKEEARLRRQGAKQEDLDEQRDRVESRREILDQIAAGGDPDQVAREAQQKVVLKKSTARRNNNNAAGKPAQQTAGRSVDAPPPPLFEIQGLKPILAPEPEKPYSPFGDLEFVHEYYNTLPPDTTGKYYYEHPWLEQARTDPVFTTGGYDVCEYTARAMQEAFAGLGVFVEDEVEAREREKIVATEAAAEAAGGGGEGVDGDVL